MNRLAHELKMCVNKYINSYINKNKIKPSSEVFSAVKLQCRDLKKKKKNTLSSTFVHWLFTLSESEHGSRQE